MLRCAACKNTADKAVLSLCGECFSVAYCNSQCQTAHWNAGHFDQCAKIDAPVFFELMRLGPAPKIIWEIIISRYDIGNPVDLVADLLDIMTGTVPDTEMRGNELALMHDHRKRFLRWLFDLGQEVEKELPKSDGPKPSSFNKLFPTYAKRKWLRRAILLAACQRPKIQNFESPVVLVEQLFELLRVPPMFILRQCFVAAAEAGHLDLIQLLTTKYNLVLTDGDKNGALVAAAKGGSMDVTQYLLDQYFAGYISYHVWNQLKNETKNVEIVKLLIQIGKRVNYNYTKQSRRNVFINAVHRGHLETVKFFLEDDSVVTDQKTIDSAFEVAVSGGHVEIAKLLFKKGVNIKNLVQWPLQEAAAHGHLEMIKFLLEDIVNRFGKEIWIYQAIDAAVTSRHADVVKLLYQYGASLSERIDAIVRFAEDGNLEMVKFLMEKGFNPRMDGDSALQNAAEQGHLQVVKFLLEQGADIEVCRYDHVIQTVIDNGHIEMLKFLLENGIKMPLGAGFMITDLAKSNHLEMTKFLLEKGAVDFSSTFTENAMEFAASLGHLEIVKLLLKTSDLYDFAIRAAVGGEQYETILYLLGSEFRKDTPIEALNEISENFPDLENVADALLTEIMKHRDFEAMDAAVRQGALEIIRRLLKTSDLYGFAIRAAVRGKQQETILYLLNSEFRRDTPIEVLNEISENFPDLKNVADALLTEIRRPRDSEEALEPAPKSLKQKIFLF